jgi:hypothetical protein
MLEYVLKSSACMIAFLLFYQFLLEKENMHQFKRFFLLGALFASLIIPALVFTEYLEAAPQNIAKTTTSYNTQEIPVAMKPISDMDVINWPLILGTIYGLGFLFFGFRFTKHLHQILYRIRKNPKMKGHFVTRVLLREHMPPHTFFSYIFLNKEELENKTIPNEVILHEETHAKQYHSLDVLLIELLQVIFWFNPLLFLFKKKIKLNHEFLADSAVLNQKVPTKKYQNTLLSYLSNDSMEKYQSIKMAHAINYSSIKKRFTVMKKQTSKKSVVLRALLLLPLLALLLFSFSERKIIQETKKTTRDLTETKASEQELSIFNTLAKEYNGQPIEKRIIPLKELRLLERIYKKMSVSQKEQAQPFPECLPKNLQKGASREQMKEYNALAKKYNEMSRENMRVKIKEVERMKYIYGLMSDKQKADAEPFPDFPVPPEPPTFRSPPEVREIPPPPTPPTPPSPVDHIIEMAKKGATFFYEGKKVSSDKAIELLKTNENLNIETTKTNSKNPQVKITKEGVKIKTSSTKSIETGNLKVNGKELFFTKKDGITSYFDTNGKQVTRKGRPLNESPQKKPTYYFNGEQISSVRAHELLRNNTSIQVTNKDYSEDEYAVILTDLNKVSSENYNKNPNSIIDLTEMIEKEAYFYYNDEPISTEKAIWLTQNTAIQRVQTVGTKKGKPKVYFWTKA